VDQAGSDKAIKTFSHLIQEVQAVGLTIAWGAWRFVREMTADRATAIRTSALIAVSVIPFVQKLMRMLQPHEIEMLKKATSITDQNGQFNFTGLPKWHYLLEVYNGPNLLYRDLIDMNKETKKNIILKDKEKVYEPNIKVKIIPSEYRW